MNKKIQTVLFSFVFGVMPFIVNAAEVSDRIDCNTLQSKINELSAVSSPDESQADELKKLQDQYRANCSKTASGRRTSTSVRASTSSATATQAETPVVAETVVLTAQGALDTYIKGRQDLCSELQADINTLTSAGSDDSEIKPLQNQYDKDCTDIDKSQVEEVDAETAAANVAAGLCTDGSKPNRFGCCDGETFKDMGNLVFACCPDDGGECYPPITSGGAI